MKLIKVSPERLILICKVPTCFALTSYAKFIVTESLSFSSVLLDMYHNTKINRCHTVLPSSLTIAIDNNCNNGNFYKPSGKNVKVQRQINSYLSSV